jgi:kynurenine formamidase
MEIVDLSRELHHRTQVHPSHPPVVIGTWYDHSEKKQAGDTVFSSKALSIAFSDHAGTHVDAPVHFDSRPGAKSIDEMPLEQFYTSGICLDLSHAPLRHAIAVPEMEAALAKSGEEIRKGDTVLLHMATNERLLGKPGYLHDFPGLALESVHWLADRGIGMFGVEAVSPAPEGEPNFQAHLACGERGITHIECLANLDRLVGRGRFRFVGFPLRIRGGTASPIRAVAIFE